MGTMLTLPYLATVKTGSGVFSRFVSFTALISYSIYLVHWSPFERLALPFLTAVPIAVRIVIYFGWAFGAGYVLHRVVERPAMALRERLVPERR
ncbi:MAG: hypothetical protein EOO15_19000 [Chitinophagaceae bacterium]|nr:MAG: hypothetical protein EOO15_19000 [Chitinophagaceae bacterium]